MAQDALLKTHAMSTSIYIYIYYIYIYNPISHMCFKHIT